MGVGIELCSIKELMRLAGKHGFVVRRGNGLDDLRLVPKDLDASRKRPRELRGLQQRQLESSEPVQFTPSSVGFSGIDSHVPRP